MPTGRCTLLVASQRAASPASSFSVLEYCGDCCWSLVQWRLGRACHASISRSSEVKIIFHIVLATRTRSTSTACSFEEARGVVAMFEFSASFYLLLRCS